MGETQLAVTANGVRGQAAPRHILIVDDDRDFGESLVDILETRHYVVELACSATAAKQTLETFAAEVAVTDIRLGRSSGIDLINEFQCLRPGIVVVMMTAYTSAGTAIKALREGAYDYLRKPFHPDELLTILQRALEKVDLLREKKAAEQALRESEDRYRALYDDNPSMYFTVAADGRLLSVNRFGAEQLGYGVEELTGRSIAMLYDEAERSTVTEQLGICLRQAGAINRWEQAMVCRNGVRLHVRQTGRAVENFLGQPTVLLVCEDISEAHRLSRQLSYQASHDALTGLLNRREFERRLQRVINTAQIEGNEHAVCYLDLDQFKTINDACGHVAGDELLRQLGGVLQRQVRKRDSLARIGGDEFSVLIEHCDLGQAMRVANGLRESIASLRFFWENKVFNIGASIGLAPITAASESVTAVLKMADMACYTAKDRGRNRIHVYRDEDVDLRQRHREMPWVKRLRRALENGCLQLYYQPIRALNQPEDRAFYELLLRLREEDGRLVAPGLFLPAAERYGLMCEIDCRVIQLAFDWFAADSRRLERLFLCAINLSGHSLGDERFVEFVTGMFASRDIPPEKICFEIAETAAVAHLAATTRFISAMKELGCRFALDDFGRGLSSFAYLKTLLPVDFLKIDGLFIKGISDDLVDQTMVKSINEIAHVMGKRTIAEFVEDQATLEKLRAIGLDYAQGYVLGRLQPLTELGKTDGMVAGVSRHR